MTDAVPPPAADEAADPADRIPATGHSIFAGGGELGRAMAARDWAQTPLGAPEGWPAALRNAVRIVLTSRFAMWAAWGPELIAFYNDAYKRDTLQAKHPWALGRPASEMWAEIWHDIGPRIRSVLDTGVATWDEDLQLFLERSGYPEETYHTFSYSPLEHDDGRTEGMLCVVTETTERVVGERRLAHLRDVAAAVATARSEADVLAALAEQLGRNPADLPFSAVYLFDGDGDGEGAGDVEGDGDGGGDGDGAGDAARLAAAAGIDPGTAATPTRLRADEAEGTWPLARVRAGEHVLIEDVGERFPDLPTGAWQRPPVQAVAVPIGSAQERGPATGVLVVGLNPHRRYDDGYRGYVELVANQIASGLLNAGSYEAERRRAEALAELDRAKTDFFSNVSHEFRTPLTLIMGPVAELRGSPVVDRDPRLREELEVIHRNALRLGRLVNTLLDFSRLQAGRIDARFEPVDLAATTAELASVFRSAIGRAGLAFAVDCEPIGEPVHIDRDMWEKVVLNLLSNALKFTFDGSIAVRLRRDGDAALLTVADTGTGIPAEELPRLFERFSRVSGARARSGEGSGIGLAMVRELVTLHGGTVEVASTPGVGTTFAVRIPLGTAHLPTDRLAVAPSSAPAVSPSAAPFVSEALRWLPGPETGPTPSPPDAPTGHGATGEEAIDEGPAAAGTHRGGGGQHTGRVLVADDNADMREYLQRLLEPRYDVRAVPDGRAALEAALAEPPDLVVSDVMMPRLDGMQLLAALRADARTSRIPVLLLSARAGQEAAVEGLAAGADDYLVKPFSAQELLARVGAHLSLGRARREAEERFAAITDLTPALIWVAGPDRRRVFVNRGWTAFTGRPVDAELGDGWRAALHPEDRRRYAAAVERAGAQGRGWEVEFRLRRSDGAYHWLIERAVPIGAGDTFAGYVGSCTDINARYRETERQTLLASVGATLDRETSVDDQLAGLARMTVDSRLADLCTVRLVEDDGRLRVAAAAGLDPETEAQLVGADPRAGLAPAVLGGGAAVLEAEIPVPPPGAAPAPDDVTHRLGVRSRISVPLTVRGRVLAVLGLGRRGDAPPYNDDDRALAEEIAARAALALDNALLLAEERAAAVRLGLLQRATAELSAATTPVDVATAAASHVRQLLGAGPRVGVYELDPTQRALVALTLDGVAADDDHWRRISLTAPLAVARAAAERRPVWVEDPTDWPGAGGGVTAEQAEDLRAFGFASSVALPLVVAGRVVGAIGAGFPRERRFDAVERSMLAAVAEQCAQALDRARLYRAERTIAQTLQLSLLPHRLPAFERLALAAQYLPGAEGTSAGGDWYDVVELGDSRVALAVGDVVGQGPAAAAVMGQLRSALSTALLQGRSPAEALELLDRFAGRLPGALASTAACMVLDWAAGTVRWARAGHPPPLLLSADGPRLLDGEGGAVLGVPGRPPYREDTVRLAPGATLLLYTDGLLERRGEHLDEGLARLTAAAARLAGTEPGRLTRELLAAVLADADQPDDVAVLAARFLPPPLRGRIAAEPTRLSAVRRAVQTWGGGMGLDEDMLEDLQLALGEALANAVEHAYAGPGDGECGYALERDPDGGVRVCVEDRGTWRPPPADRGHRGRGLELIGALGTDVDVRRTAEDTGTTVRFRIPAPPAPAPWAARPPVPGERPPAGVGAGRGGGAHLEVHPEPGGLRLALAGELDLASAGALRAEIRRRVEPLPAGAVVVVDLRPTSYLASAGVGLLLECAAEARSRGRTVRVVTAPGSVPARILRLTGVDAQLGGPSAGS